MKLTFILLTAFTLTACGASVHIPSHEGRDGGHVDGHATVVQGDHDKGHGNDADRIDEDNPGKKYQRHGNPRG